MMRKTHKIKFTAILLLLILTSFTIGQVKKYSKDQCPESKKTKATKAKISSKTSKVTSKTKPVNYSFANSFIHSRKRIVGETVKSDDSISEKSIKVYPKVNISMCVKRGKVKVNGWKRNEVRAFLVGGDKVDISVLETDSRDRPAWIKVLGSKSKKSSRYKNSECLSGKVIELDVPLNTSISIKGEESEVTIDSVRKATVQNVGGDIFLNEISYRTNAQTYRGNVTVRNSVGKVFVSTNVGNIVGFNTKVDDIGDYFKAKTLSGSVTLQSVGQGEVEARSSSGSINFIGNIKNSGQYSFNTTSGRINLVIPRTSSCQIGAYYQGSFESEIPIKNLVKTKSSIFTNLTGQIGTGRCSLDFRTYSGRINIRSLK